MRVFCCLNGVTNGRRFAVGSTVVDRVLIFEQRLSTLERGVHSNKRPPMFGAENAGRRWSSCCRQLVIDSQEYRVLEVA